MAVSFAPTTPTCDINNDGIYELTNTYQSTAIIDYKFFIGNIADANLTNCSGAGYENNLPAPCGFGNYGDRQHIVNSIDAILPAVCFGSCEVCNSIPCFTSLNISGLLATNTYSADDIINCSGQVNLGSGGPVILQAGANAGGSEYIQLLNNFDSDGKVDFTAINIQCDFTD